MNHSKVDQKERDSRKHYRVIADRDKGEDPTWDDVHAGDRVTSIWTVDGDADAPDRIERPVPTTDAQPSFEDVTPRGFGYTEFEFRPYVGSDPERFSVQVSSLATERKVWVGLGDDRAHLDELEARRVRDALNAFLGELSPSLPTREQIAEALAEAEGPDGFRSWDQIADAVLALLQKGAER